MPLATEPANKNWQATNYPPIVPVSNGPMKLSRKTDSKKGLAWIVAVILTFIVVVAILFMLQPCYVTKTDFKGNVILDTGNLLLWSIIFTVIIVIVLWMAKKSSLVGM